MKKILIFVIFTIMFIACGDNGVSSEPTTQPSVQQPTYSSSSNSSETVLYWSFEIGNVCNGYNIDVAINDKSKPVESYYAMYQICGDRANFTYVCEPLEQSVQHILTFLNKETALQVVELAENYGAAFGFYNANDGYLRYIYFEQCYDNKALMKRH